MVFLESRTVKRHRELAGLAPHRFYTVSKAEWQGPAIAVQLSGEGETWFPFALFTINDCGCPLNPGEN